MHSALTMSQAITAATPACRFRGNTTFTSRTLMAAVVALVLMAYAGMGVAGDRGAALPLLDQMSVGETARGAAQGSASLELIDLEFGPRRIRTLEAMWERLHAISHVSHQDWKLILVNAPGFQAMADEGRRIMVFRTILDSASLAGLAAVIGHELAHAALGHINDEAGDERNARLEAQADRLGLLYASLAGYDPRAAVSLLKTNLVHPTSRSRAAYVARAAQWAGQFYQAGRIHPYYWRVLNDYDPDAVASR